MRVLIQHRSRYQYPRPALLGPQVIRLRPADHAGARIESYTLSIVPHGGATSQPEARVHWHRDPHANHVARVTFKAGEAIEALDLVVEIAVDIKPINPFDFFVADTCKRIPFVYPDGHELAPFLDTSDPAYRFGKKVSELLRTLPADGDSVGLLVELNAAVNRSLKYVIRNEPGVWTPEETVTNGRGSCRDLAVLLVALLRARGIAARFVSGYLVQLADEGMLPDEPKGVARDVVDLHAWAEAFIPGAGWIGLDATSGLMCGEGHIPLAATASPATAAPLDGTSNVGASDVSFSTTIERLGHEIRPTAPYTDETWTALLAAGDRADAALTAAGLEVWAGGEPTFVSRENQMADEWQGAALGPGKWRRGRKLAELLRDRLAPGGVVLHRMGKHYPGESMPRWALDVIGRRDAVALWPVRRFPDLEWSLDADGTKHGHEIDEAIATARHFAEELAAALGVVPELHPAYEDPWEVIRAEARLPATLDPKRAGLEDPEERRRLARVLDHGVGRVIGWVMPLARIEGSWRTQRWTLRREHLFLLPGESPLGLRLPLDSLLGTAPPLWADAPDLPDPRRDEPATPDVQRIAPDVQRIDREQVAPIPVDDLRAPERRAVVRPERGDLGIRTAISIEPRDGQLWIFVPPIARFADFCALVEAIDAVRVAVSVDVHLEGYSPPPSPNLLRFAVTPDPGVLEVNLPPQTSARAMAELHATVFDTALAAGLTAERYLLDGRAAGSGGGNHITVGGPTAARSPWFARPDLLASLLAFVQHHPALSYMFSGLFVGPTSQAPRIDEARHDALYELEIALPRLHERPPAWEVDALLRNLLVDVAGSTHRAEISIDKLFDPRTPFGRQGLVELRAFEMPPHPRMCAAQVVLVRAILAALAANPYRHPLVRWGTELHDKFLLPYWMARDFEDVLAHLARCDQPLPAAAFEAFLELRCPIAGLVELADGRVEVRNAIEPWHVLGEEATATGTARYVDSSIERIELRAIGLDHERYSVTVNGWVVPLRPTERRDTRVGGVRFRAWCPPHALQPHLGIHHPLRIEIVDSWGARSVAAGTYHVWHPEGQGFEAAPLTRVEAAARRAQRFTHDGGSPSPVRPQVASPHPDQPYTLDLRRLDMGRPMSRTEDWHPESWFPKS